MVAAMEATKAYRSPLRKRPLPTAGQSIDQELWDTVRADMLGWCVGAGTAVLWAILEWVQFFTSSPPSPVALSGVAVFIVGLAVVRLRRLRGEAERLAMARDGELIVAEMLQKLVAAGWHVFHDVPATGFNIDHVAIGQKGVLVIETKTRSKPAYRKASIDVNADGIVLAGQHIGWEPVQQADRQAAWLAKKLQQGTGRSFPVRPVVLFPGWYINDRRQRKEPWVMSGPELSSWVEREPDLLENEGSALAIDYLDRYIRGPYQGTSR